jgi:hypothetical protein
MRKLLPFRQPLAYGYQFYAYPLGILATHRPASDWVLSNFVQVVYDPADASPVPFAFYIYDYALSPWLETLRVNREWCEMHDRGIAGIVRDAISRNFYLNLTLNERYVPERRAYRGPRDFLHDVLIRGVDDRAGTYDLVGYDQNMRFRSTGLPQQYLPMAYHRTGPEPYFEIPVTMYRVDNANGYTFDLRFIAQGVEEYLESFNSSGHFQAYRDPWDRVYGVATYDLLAAYLDGYGRSELPYNIRHLQVLWEHKRLMVARLTRCAELVAPVVELIEPYRRIERQVWALRMRMMAQHAGRDTGDFRAAARSVLDTVRVEETQVLGRFASYLAAASAQRARAGAPGIRSSTTATPCSVSGGATSQATSNSAG